MEIDNIFGDIKFKVNPNQDYRKSYNYRLIKGLLKLIKKDKEFDFSNCIINKEIEDKDLRKALVNIESMSTYAIGYVINRITIAYAKIKNWSEVVYWGELYFNLPVHYRDRSTNSEKENIKKRI